MDVRLEVRDERGRSADARQVHEGGGLLTIAFDGEPLAKLQVGDVVRWTPLGSRSAAVAVGTIASLYPNGPALHVVISPQQTAAPAAPSAPRGPVISAPRLGAAPKKAPAATQPIATIEAGDEVLMGSVRAVGARGVAIYVRRPREGLLEAGTKVRLAIQLPGRSSDLVFMAGLASTDALQHGALCRFEVDRESAGFQEHWTTLARYFGPVAGSHQAAAAGSSATRAGTGAAGR